MEPKTESKMEECHFSQGEVIFLQDDVGDLAYLIGAGAVEISRTSSEGKSVLGVLSPGQVFGEMTLISNRPRSATATAVQDTICFTVPLRVFNKELERTSALMRSLLLSFISHIRNMMVQMEALEARIPSEKTKTRDSGGAEFFEMNDKGVYKKLEF